MPEKFVVPQFIDNEDKILGPMTVRQFLIILGAVLIIFIQYALLRAIIVSFFPFFLLLAIPTIGLSAVFAFLKINGQAFHIFFLNFLQTNIRPKQRIWDKAPTDQELRAYIKEEKEVIHIPHTPKTAPSTTRLRDLALTVNTGGVYRPDDEDSH